MPEDNLPKGEASATYKPASLTIEQSETAKASGSQYARIGSEIVPNKDSSLPNNNQGKGFGTAPLQYGVNGQLTTKAIIDADGTLNLDTWKNLNLEDNMSTPPRFDNTPVPLGYLSDEVAARVFQNNPSGLSAEELSASYKKKFSESGYPLDKGDETMVKADIFRKALYGSDVNLNNSLDVSILNYGSVPTSDLFYEGVQGEVAFPYRRYQEWNESLINNGLYNKPSDRLMDESFNSANIDVKSQLAMQKMREADPLTYRAMQLGIHPSVGIWASLSNNPFDLVHSNISKAQEDLIAAGRLNPDFSLSPTFTPTLKSGDFQKDSPSSSKALSSQMESLSVIQNQLNSDMVAIKGEIDNDVQSSPEYKAYKESADLYNKESADWAGTFSKDVIENYSNKLTQATKFYNDNKAEIDEAIATRGEYDEKYKLYENEQDLNVKEKYGLELSALEERMLKSFNYKQYNKKAEELNKLSSQKDIEAYNQASNPQSAVFKARESLLEASASLREKEAATRAKYQDKISEFEDRQTSLYLSVVKENENSEAAGFIPYVTGVKYSEINKDNVVEVFQNLFDNLSDVKYANFLSDRNNETAYSAYVKNGILPELDRYTSSDTKGGLLTPDDASMLRSQSYINSTVSQKINYILDMVAKAPDYYNQVYKDAFDLQTIDGVKGLNSKAIEDYNAKGLIYESLSSIRIKAQAKTNMEELEKASTLLEESIYNKRKNNLGQASFKDGVGADISRDDNRELEKYNLAGKITQGILRTVDEGIPVDSFMQGVKDVVRGVKDSLLQDPLSYVPFISSIVSLDDQTVVYDILNRKKNGEILSKADNMVLESMALNQLQSTYINKDNIYYNTYNSFPKTVAFMGELFVGNMLGGVIFNTASKMLEGAYSFLFRGMANAEATGVLLTTGKTVKGLFGSAEWLTSSEGVANFKKVMSYASSLGSQNIATLGSVANSTMERLSPPLVVSQSQYEQGRILFDVMESQETTSGALKKSLISNLISVTVEGWGGVIDKGIGLTFKGLSVSGRTILDSVSHGVSSSTSPKAIAFTRFVKSISENPKLIQAFKSNTFVRGSSTLYRGLTFGENGAFPILSSLPAETMEEVIDSGLQMAILGEGPALWKKDPIAQATKIATQAMYVMSPLYMFRFGGAVLRTSARAVGSMATLELSEADFHKNSIISFPTIGGKSIIGMTIRKSEYKAVQSLINELGNTDRTVDPAKIQSLERSLLGDKHLGGKERGLISGRGMFELMKQTFEYHNEYLNSTSDLTFGKYVKEITDAKKALNARINEAIANDIKDKSEMSRQEINDERNENLALMESVANTPTSEKAKQEMRNIIDVAKKYYASGQTAVTLKQLLKEAEVLDSRIKERYHRLVNKGVATSIGGVFADINRLAELTGDTRLYSNEARVMRGVIDNNPILDYDSINKALDSDNNVIADYVNQALDREVISIHSGIGITATVSVQDNGKRVLSIDRSEEEVKDLLDTIDINSPYYNKLLYALTSKGATFSDVNSTVNVAVEIARDLMSSAFEEDDKFHFNPLVKGLYLVNRLALNDDLNPTIIDEVMTMFRETEMFGYSKSDQSYYVNKDLYRMMSATFTAMTQMNGLFNEDTKMTPMGLLSEIDKMKVISDELHEHYTGTIQDYIPEVLDADDNSSLIEDAPLIDSDFTGTVDSSKMRAKDILLTVARFMEKVIGMKPYQAKNIRQIMERTANGLVAAGVYKDVETALRSMPLYSYATNANHTRESQDFRNIAEHLLKNSDFAFEVKFLTGDEMRAKSLELGITNMSSVDSYQAGVTPLPTGFFHEGVVYLNSDMPVNNALGSDRNVYTSNSVLIRQFAMPFLENLKKTNPEVYLEGVKKLKSRDGKVLLDYLRAKNPELKGEALSMEALLLLTTEQGDILLQNAKEKSLTEWVEKFWDWVKGKIGLPNTATDKLKAMSLADYGTATAISVLQGNKSGSIESGMSKEEIHANDIKNKFRATFAGKGVKDVHIDAALAIMDIRAQAWASEKKGRKAEQWYDRIADIGTGDFNIRGQVQYQMEDGRTAETTPEKSGQPLFQDQKGKKRGAVETLEDGRVIIHALESPDVSTLVHEIFHVFEKDLTPDEVAQVEALGGSEVFANAGVRYLHDGVAPTPALQPLFDKFASWLGSIYKNLRTSLIGKNVNPAIKTMLERLLTVTPPTAKEAESRGTSTNTGVFDNIDMRFDSESGELTFYKDGNQVSFINATAEWFYDQVMKNQNNGVNSSSVKTSITEAVNELMEQYKEGGKSNSSKWIEREAERMRYENPDADESVIDDIMRRRLFAKAIEAYVAGGKEYKINSKENPDGSFVFRRVAKATQLHKAFRAFAKFFSKYAEKEDGKFNSTEFPFKLNNLIIKAANAMFNIDTTGKSYFFHFNKWRGSSAADEIKSSTKANKEIIKSIAEHFDSNLESLSPESIEEALDFIHSNMQKVKVDILKAVKGKLTLTAKQISDLMFTPRMNSPQEYLAHLAKQEKYFTDSKYREKIDNLQKAIDGARARQKSSSKKDSDFGKSMRELLRVPIKAFIKEKDIVKFTNIFNTIYQNSDQEVTQKNKELARSIYEDYLLSKQMEDQARRDNLQDNASVAEYLDEVIGLDELEIARLTGMEVTDINKIDGEYKKIWKAGKRKGLARSLNVNDMAELDDESRRIDNDTIQARREVIEQQRQISLAKVSNNDIISDLIADIDLEDLSFKELNKFSGMLTYIANNGRPNKDISDFVIAYMAKRNDTYVKNNANKRFKRMLDDAADRNHWFNNFHWNPVTFSMIKENGRLGLPRALLSLGAISNYTLIHFIDFLDGMTNNMRGHISNLITSPIQDAEERFEKAMTEIMTNVGKLKADMTVEELYLSGITSLLNQKSKINFNRDIVEAKVLSLKKQEEGVDPVTGRAIIIEDMDSADEKYDSLDQHSKELYDVIAELQQPNNQEALANLRANPDIAYTDFYYYDPYDGQYKIHDDVDTSGFRYRIYEAVNKKKLRNVAASIIFSLGGDPSLVFKEYEGMMKNLQGKNRFESVKNTSMKIDNHLVAKSLKQIYGVSSIEKMVEDIFNGNVNYDTPQSIALKNYTRQVFTKIRNGDYSDGLDMEYAGNIFSNTGFEDIQDYAPLIRYGEFNNKTHSIDQAGVRPLEMTATEGAFVDTDVMKSSVNVNSSFMRRRGSSLSLLELSAFEQIRKKADQELFYLNHEPHRRMLHTLTNTEGGFFSTWKTDQSNKYSSGYFREPNMQSQANQDVRLSPGAAKDFQQKLSAFYIRNMTPSKIALNNSHVSKYIMDSWNLMKASILSASYASVSQMSVLFSLPQEYDNFVPTGAATNIMDTLEALTDVGKDRFEDFIMEHAPEVALRGVSVYNLANIKPGKLADRIMLVASSLNGQGNKIALKNKAALAERIRLFKDGYELLEFLKQSNKSGNASDSDIILMQVLAFDRYAAKITFHSAYKNFLKDIGEDVNYDNPNQDAIDFAIALIRRTQNSDASIWKPGYNIGIGKGVNFHEDGSRGEVIRQSWFSFKSFSINEQTNQRRNAIMTLTDPDKGTAQKMNDLANVLLSGLANRAAYEISKKYLKGLMVQSLLTMQYWLGWDDDDYNQPSKDGLWEHGTIKESLVRAEKIIRELNNKNGVSIASLESGYTQIKGYDYYDTYYQITDLLFKLGLSEVGSGSLAGLARGYVGNLVDQRSTSVNEDGDIVKKDISKTLFPITQDTEGVLSDALPLLDMLSYTTDLAFLFKTAGGNLDYLLNKDDYNGEVPDDVLTWRNQKGKLYRALINSLLMFNVGLRGKSNFPSSLPFVRPRDTDVIIKTMNKANDFNKVDTKKVEINLED